MKEALSHLFVWIATPGAVFWIAGYSLYKREFILGALASASMLLICAAIAMQLFDNDLLFYQLIYTVLAVVPGLMGIVAILSLLHRLMTFLMSKFRPKARN